MGRGLLDPIVGIEIKGTELNKQFIDDKYSRLDVKATTSSNEICDRYASSMD